MPPETASRRTKKLVRLLFELQEFDSEVTAPICVAIKFYLRCSRHCRAFEVLPGSDTAMTMELDRSIIPKFFMSQLEIQNLTEQVPISLVTISPLVFFVLSCIPSYLTKEDSLPTLFHWQNPVTHRTSVLFAHVDKFSIMPFHSYTAQELLSLRGQAIPVSLSDAPIRDQDNVDPIASQRALDIRTINRHTNRRPLQSLPVMHYQNDGPSPADDAVYVGRRSRNGTDTAAPSELEWRYRGRSESDAVSTIEPTPLPAPTGLNAQKSEGFQRFYKAVVSPTHVRVTAGGRIVPNTRGTSPASKRPKEKLEVPTRVQSSGSQNQPEPAQQQDTSLQNTSKPPSVPMFAYPHNPFFPQFSGPVPSLPMMPLPLGLGMPGAFPFGPMVPGEAVPPSFVKQVPASEKENQRKDSQSGTVDAKGMSTSTAKPAESTKASSLAQLEPSKPVMVNGQLMYPFPPPAPFPTSMPPGPHSAYLPAGFLGHPGFPMAPFPNPMLAPATVPMNQIFPPPLQFPPPVQGSVPPVASGPGTNDPATVPPVGAPNAASSAEGGALHPPAAPPVSSIRPSEISRKQIDLLRNSLKYHEDQLLYNKHQIDEKEMERTVKMLQSQIDRFEALNRSQLLYEETHYPKKERKPSDTSTHNSRRSDRRTRTDSTSMSGSRYGTYGSSSRRGDRVRHRPSIPTGEKTDMGVCFHSSEHPVHMTTDPVKKSALPSAAALAPPFEPRPSPGQVRHPANNQRPAPGRRAVPITRPDGTLVQFEREPSSHSSAAGSVRSNNLNRNKQRLHDSSSEAENQLPMGPSQLPGSLPINADSQSIRGNPFDYRSGHELTEDEIRAIQLHWGRAPTFARKGLPKFDGKGFYPQPPSVGEMPQNQVPQVLQAPQVPRVARVSRGSQRPEASPVPTQQIPTGDVYTDYGIGNRPPKAANYLYPVTMAPPSATTEAPASAPRGLTIDAVKPKRVKVTLKRPNEEDTSQSLKSGKTNALATEGGQPSAKPKAAGSSKVTTTAHGILPRYGRYENLATTSLSPIVASPNASSHPSPVKSDDGSVVITGSRRIGENCPPPGDVGPASLEHQFRHVVSMEGKRNAALPVH